jgi:hypothetical protein
MTAVTNTEESVIERAFKEAVMEAMRPHLEKLRESIELSGASQDSEVRLVKRCNHHASRYNPVNDRYECPCGAFVDGSTVSVFRAKYPEQYKRFMQALWENEVGKDS